MRYGAVCLQGVSFLRSTFISVGSSVQKEEAARYLEPCFLSLPLLPFPTLPPRGLLPSTTSLLLALASFLSCSPPLHMLVFRVPTETPQARGE